MGWHPVAWADSPRGLAQFAASSPLRFRCSNVRERTRTLLLSTFARGPLDTVEAYDLSAKDMALVRGAGALGKLALMRFDGMPRAHGAIIMTTRRKYTRSSAVLSLARLERELPACTWSTLLSIRAMLEQSYLALAIMRCSRASMA